MCYQATIRCTTESDTGHLLVNFTATLPAIASSGVLAGSSGAGTITDLINNFEYQKDNGPVNMWYGMQLTAAWYSQLSTGM